MFNPSNQGNNFNNNNNNLGPNFMNMNNNSLYQQKFQQTYAIMQQNPPLIETNLNNMNNILSLINLPVLVPYHIEHPLINCKTPGRALPNHNWVCNQCNKHYSYNVPCFYCTNCDFDLCQKCFINLYAYQIVVYNYNYGPLQVNSIVNRDFYKSHIHNHPLVLIQRDESYYVSDYHCNFCTKAILKNEPFHFCSVCNYCVCQTCYNVKLKPQGNKLCNDPEYLSQDQMKP